MDVKAICQAKNCPLCGLPFSPGHPDIPEMKASCQGCELSLNVFDGLLTVMRYVQDYMVGWKVLDSRKYQGVHSVTCTVFRTTPETDPKALYVAYEIDGPGSQMMLQDDMLMIPLDVTLENLQRLIVLYAQSTNTIEDIYGN